MLTSEEVDRFVEEGCVAVPGAFSRAVAEACVARMWPDTGCDPDDPATWTEPVVRLEGYGDPPFAQAAASPRLAEACDQLVGAGRWVPRTGLGTIPVRFPSERDPGDDGWHVEACFVGPDGVLRTDLGSTNRALLMLFLFTDTGPDDAPTRVRLGSHLDVPALLAPHGEGGAPSSEVSELAARASLRRPEAVATGEAGTVWLCHPFLVHAAQSNRSGRPRFMAQPPLPPTRPLDLSGVDPSPVERAVLRGLGPAA